MCLSSPDLPFLFSRSCCSSCWLLTLLTCFTYTVTLAGLTRIATGQPKSV